MPEKNIICLLTYHSPQVGVKYSAGMEVFALKSLLDFLSGCGIQIAVLVTDRSTTIRAMMAKEFSSISHQFDVWYYTEINASR